MDTGNHPENASDRQAVIDMTVQKADEIVAEFHKIEGWVAQAEANIKAARERQDTLRTLYAHCSGTAALFTFDLERERQEAADRANFLNNLTLDDLHDLPDKPKTVREILLDLGREAEGRPLRVAAVRQELEIRLGRAVHDKTAGMTLYRLSKEGAFERRGYDWYFVSEADRLRRAENLGEELGRQMQAATTAQPKRKPPGVIRGLLASLGSHPDWLSTA